MSPIRGILLDIDGVLQVGMSPLPGAAETLHWLGQNGYQFCFVTNTTIYDHQTLARRLQAIGLPIAEEQLFTAPVATANYLRQHYPGKRCWLLTKGDVSGDFSGIDIVEDQADVVVIGGAEELLSYETMNKAFLMVMNGADLLAMHTNLYWRTDHGLQLDSGAYVHALELATGKQATVLGKPNRAFFEQALRFLALSAQESLMVGDDLVNDIEGAQLAGLRSVLVCTGKHRVGSPLLERIHPQAILPSLADLPAWLVSF
jgi:HAD superfamily hydrolase (TIGR01458 family)